VAIAVDIRALACGRRAAEAVAGVLAAELGDVVEVAAGLRMLLVLAGYESRRGGKGRRRGGVRRRRERRREWRRKRRRERRREWRSEWRSRARGWGWAKRGVWRGIGARAYSRSEEEREPHSLGRGHGSLGMEEIATASGKR